MKKQKNELYGKKQSQIADIWFRLKKNKAAMCGLFVIIVIVLLALFADVIADYDTKVIAQYPSEKLRAQVLNISLAPMHTAVIYLPVLFMVQDSHLCLVLCVQQFHLQAAHLSVRQQRFSAVR